MSTEATAELTPDLESTSIEIPDATAETSEIESPETEVETEPAKPGDKPTAGDGPALANGRLSESARATLAEWAKTNPKLVADLKRARFEAEGYRQALPNGLKEVAQLREKLESFGGPEAIQKTHEELEYFNSLDQQFTAGDPRFVQAMIDTPEGQQGFLKLAPSMLEKYRELAPEAHDSYIAKQQYQGMLDADLKFSIVRIKDAIDRLPDSPEKQAALDQWGPLAVYYNGVLEKANKKVDLPKIAAPTAAPDERAQLQKDRQDFVRQQWQTEASNTAKTMIDSQLAQIAKERKLTDTQRDAVLELGVARLKKALAKAPNFNETSQRHFANNDRDGFLRHIAGVYRQQIPLVFKAAADAIVAQRNGVSPKPAPANGTTPGRTAAPGSTAKPAEGYTWVAGTPKKETIDFAKTTADMIRQGKAVLQGNRRVQWRQG